MRHISKNIENKTGTVSNLQGFLHRSLDTGFKTKWHGYWSPPYKYLDYYAYRINGIWLDANTLESVEYGETLRYTHQLSSLTVIEHVKMENLNGFKSVLEIKNNAGEKKAVQVSLEAGIDIRRQNADISEQDYSIEMNDKSINVSSGDKELTISADRKIISESRPHMKEHYPGERQKCMVPGKIVLRSEIMSNETEKIVLAFETSEDEGKCLETFDQCLKDTKISECFNSSLSSVENLIYNNDGLGIIAGHPWFQSYWARDTFWTLLGFIDAGYYEESLQILENFAERGVPGKINLDESDEVLGRPDTAPLFIIAADKLRKHYRISETIEAAMIDAFDRLETENSVVVHNSEGTWMDTLERPKAIDIQSLWLEAAKIMGKRVTELEKGLEKFKQDEYAKDYLGEDAPHTINPTVPIMFGQFGDKYLSKINGEFSSRFGARTRSITDPGYKSSGYHSGSSWGLTTCWAAMANFENNKVREGLNFLESLCQFIDRGQIGALPEVVDSEDGENLGCVEQAWSAGLVIHAIDSYLLGIKVTEETVEINPKGDISCKRLGKRIGDSELDLEFDKGEVKILNEPDIERKLIT